MNDPKDQRRMIDALSKIYDLEQQLKQRDETIKELKEALKFKDQIIEDLKMYYKDNSPF